MSVKKSFTDWDPGIAGDFVARWEGCRLTAYKCPAGLWTIGYGHTGGVREGDTVTKAEARSLLEADLATAAKTLVKAVKVPVAEGQFIALVSLAFNVGAGLPQKAPRLFRALNAGDEAGAAKQFLDINKAGGKVLPGLTARRRAEAAFFLGEQSDAK